MSGCVVTGVFCVGPNQGEKAFNRNPEASAMADLWQQIMDFLLQYSADPLTYGVIFFIYCLSVDTTILTPKVGEWKLGYFEYFLCPVSRFLNNRIILGSGGNFRAEQYRRSNLTLMRTLGTPGWVKFLESRTRIRAFGRQCFFLSFLRRVLWMITRDDMYCFICIYTMGGDR